MPDTYYGYDANANLMTQSHPPMNYHYDALNRLRSCENVTDFHYDGIGRCMRITDTLNRQLLYQQEHEIGSLIEGQLKEFKLIHPQIPEIALAIELNGQVLYPIQDHRHHICALQNTDGTMAAWYRYSAFGPADDEPNTLENPWRFSNRRQIAGLSLFTHRFYNPKLMRWMSTDPLGFEDGLNKYLYVRNNPLSYCDPDGRFVFVLPLFTYTLGGALTFVSAPAVAGAVLGAVAAYGTYQLANYISAQMQDDQGGEEGKSDEDDKRKKPDVRT